MSKKQTPSSTKPSPQKLADADWDKSEEEWRQIGGEEGRKLIRIEIIRNAVEKNIPIEEIVEFLEEDTVYVQKIYTMIKEHPDWDDEAVFEAMTDK